MTIVFFLRTESGTESKVEPFNLDASDNLSTIKLLSAFNPLKVIEQTYHPKFAGKTLFSLSVVETF